MADLLLFRRLPKIRGTFVAALTLALSILGNTPACGHPGPADSRAAPALPPTNSVLGSKAGQAKVIGGIRLGWCPPGRFRMGSPAGEPGHRADESPIEVTLTKGFWMGKYEVTQGEWKRIMGEFPGPLNAGAGDDFPVYWINFNQAEEFCRKLTVQARTSGELPAHWEFRLPTEAQWEYACRAGTTTAFSFGETLAPRQANIGKPYNGTPTGVPGSAASRVGSYDANAWGLHDLHGNEFEWCRDWYHAQLPGGIDPDLSEVKGQPNRDGTYSRVRRGGAWTDGPEFCRSAFRLRFEPERGSDHIGFRVVATSRD
jgi:formylglycine-generating enzyme